MDDKLIIKEDSFPTHPVGNSIFFNVQAFEHAQRVARVFAEATMVPEHFRSNIGNCLIALNYADRLGADPFMLMQNMCIVHNKPGLEAKLVIALVNNCGRFDPIEFEEIGDLNDPKNDADGCVAFAKELKSGKTLKGPKVDWRMVKAEGWLGKSGSKWKTMAPLMFRYRAASYFARIYCPDVLLGLQTKEELYDTIEMAPSKNGDSYAPTNVVSNAELVNSFDESATDAIPTEHMADLVNFLGMVGESNGDLSVDEVKAETMRSGQFDELIADFQKYVTGLAEAEKGKEVSDDKPDNQPPDSGDADGPSDPVPEVAVDKPQWDPLVEPVQERYLPERAKIIRETLKDQYGFDASKLSNPKAHEKLKELAVGGAHNTVDASSEDLDIELVNRFNELWVKLPKEGRNYAGEQSGCDNTVNGFKRPSVKQMPKWIEFAGKWLENQ